MLATACRYVKSQTAECVAYAIGGPATPPSQLQPAEAALRAASATLLRARLQASLLSPERRQMLSAARRIDASALHIVVQSLADSNTAPAESRSEKSA